MTPLETKLAANFKLARIVCALHNNGSASFSIQHPTSMKYRNNRKHVDLFVVACFSPTTCERYFN